MQLSDSIYHIKGVGDKIGKRFEKLNIYTVLDLITHYPRDYDDRRDIKKINEVDIGEPNTVIGTIAAAPQIMRKGKFIIVKAKIKDETGSMFVVFYGQNYMKNSLKVGQLYIFTGKINLKFGTIQMESPELELISSEQDLGKMGKIMPMYPTTFQLSQKRLRKFIETTLTSVESQIVDNVPLWIRKKYKIVDRIFAVHNIHFPQDNDAFFEARQRIVFEELFIFQVGLLMIKEGLHQNLDGILFQDDLLVSGLKGEPMGEFIQSLPFQLTNAQEKVFKEVKQDMLSPKVMNRLIQGDVGSGKTIIAVLALVLAVKNGYQTAFMAPTEVLAMQHYESLTAMLEPFNITVGVLVGSLTQKNKEKMQEEIKAHQIDIVIGTHALIQAGVEFAKLGLVITDEQHRFGVRQRVTLSEKGHNPDVLVMTATPIPRTLALILYGDLDVSVVDELPPGRQVIKTNAVNTSYRPRIYKFIQNEIANGRQAYIICPMVEESEDNDELQAVTTYTDTLKEGPFKDINVAYLHGKMKPKEKQEIMTQYVKNEIQVLVSTTVIEVGVNVPNSTVMLIENADRFGLAQLHQLRGRVGRGSDQSYCVLINDSKSKVSKERMKVMQQTNDGFIISETDLKLRGPGEFFGTRQHGLPDMKIANLYQDIPLLKLAQNAAQEVLKDDPKLSKQEHADLLNDIKRLFKETSFAVTL
ncbi:MAG TPA: ATP-dependent DNA helicase RecG [Epulopiscium sp.]|nr:ATP-dependent DNA helicase RecG [Candidatus Epulonipiscium sp.]